MEKAALSSLGNAREVFADTSYFYAVLNPSDTNHTRALQIASYVRVRKLRMVTTWDAVVETVTLLRYRAGFELASMFLNEVTPDLLIVYPVESERHAAIRIFLQRGRDMRLSMCDAISYTVVSGRLNWAPCLAFDADFAALGLTTVR